MIKNLLYIFLFPIVVGLVVLAIVMAIGQSIRKKTNKRMNEMIQEYENTKRGPRKKHLRVVPKEDDDKS